MKFQFNTWSLANPSGGECAIRGEPGPMPKVFTGGIGDSWDCLAAIAGR